MSLYTWDALPIVVVHGALLNHLISNHTEAILSSILALINDAVRVLLGKVSFGRIRRNIIAGSNFDSVGKN